jgi:hypothetical protein
VGATALAAGYQPKGHGFRKTFDDWNDTVAFLEAKWPWTEQARQQYPAGVIVAIAVWHEAYKITADGIAQHIERLEAKYDSQPAATEAAQLEEVC